jgi:hypothetical protein
VVQQYAREVRKEAIYIDVPPVLDNFINNFEMAIGFKFIKN